jgi:hypothetical protein
MIMDLDFFVGQDLAMEFAVDHGVPDMDVGVDMAAFTDYQHIRRDNFPLEETINAKGSLEFQFALEIGSVIEKSRELRFVPVPLFFFHVFHARAPLMSS